MSKKRKIVLGAGSDCPPLKGHVEIYFLQKERTAADHKLQKVVKELFSKLYERRMLVRLLGVRFSHLVPGNDQINMFEDTQQLVQLYRAIDSIKTQYGEQFITRARGVLHSQ